MSLFGNLTFVVAALQKKNIKGFQLNPAPNVPRKSGRDNKRMPPVFSTAERIEVDCKQSATLIE